LLACDGLAPGKMVEKGFILLLLLQHPWLDCFNSSFVLCVHSCGSSVLLPHIGK
jgi:hypothetical protein